MNLINKDHIFYGIKSDINMDCFDAAYRCQIECLPVIEAIPVEWLEDFRDHLGTVSESMLMSAIDMIISAWRVEQKRKEDAGSR